MFKLSDYHFDLPTELIAKYPANKRSDSRLLLVDKNTGQYQDQQFTDILELLQPNDLLVFNNTKVIPARLFAQKQTGGQIEILIERLLDDKNVLAHIRASKAPKADSLLLLNQEPIFKVIEKNDSLYQLQAVHDNVLDLLEQYGQMPLPPYLDREVEASDKERYQTVYAKEQGSVAAPTAGLHFDEAILQKLQQKNIEFTYVTLHVGAGTFQPVRHDDITQHQIHHEWLTVSQETCDKIKEAKTKGGRVICVGTTSVRSIESAATAIDNIQPYSGDTNIFIYPGYQFKMVDAILTNFHLPKSSLLMLVSAFAGFDNIKKVYEHAVEEKYRFFSYGDAMLLIAQRSSDI